MGFYMNKISRVSIVALVPLVFTACQNDVVAPMSDVTIASPALAITFDAATGVGFVGKGDVQFTFNWNNKTLQERADAVQFRYSSAEVSEVSWICTNSKNENTQERERTTTSSVQGVVESVARERNQITGFKLLGYDGDATVTDSNTEGPKLNSCPTNWILTTPAGDPTIVSSFTTFQVSFDGVNWTELLEKP